MKNLNIIENILTFETKKERLKALFFRSVKSSVKIITLPVNCCKILFENKNKELIFVANGSKKIDEMCGCDENDVKNAKCIVDILKYNPINWQNNPNEKICIVGERRNNKKLKSLFKTGIFDKHFSNYSEIKKYFVDFSDKYDKEKLKLCSVVICDDELFETKYAYTRCVLKLMAMGAPLIVGDKASLEKYIPKEYMNFIGSYDDADEFVMKCEDLFYREKLSIVLRRYVMTEFGQINMSEKKKLEKISIIVSTMRPENINQLFENISLQNYPNKELILILHGDEFDVDEIKSKTLNLAYDVRIIQKDALTIFGDNLNIGVDNATGDYITKMDDDDYYGPNHLDDIYLALHYSQATIVGKTGNFTYLEQSDVMIEFGEQAEDRWWSHLPGGTILIRTDDMKKYKFASIKKSIDAELVGRIIENGDSAYSTHRYNYIRVRHGEHTYKKDDAFFIEQSGRGERKGFDKESCFV
ncbi:MAG: glycosyltransferase family 2 protein [Candidatus Moraniibacteriota bacterium]|jgi:glycosyl transferase family 2